MESIPFCVLCSFLFCFVIYFYYICANNVSMGRNIVIGILYQVKIKSSISEDKMSDLKKYFPERLFDYNSLGTTHRLRLKDTIAPADVVDLREKALSLCSLESEKKNTKMQEMLHCAFSLQELERTSLEEMFYTFQHAEQFWIINLAGERIHAACDYFLIYVSPYKFYSFDGFDTHEITRKSEKLIKTALRDMPLIDLIKVFIYG